MQFLLSHTVMILMKTSSIPLLMSSSGVRLSIAVSAFGSSRRWTNLHGLNSVHEVRKTSVQCLKLPSIGNLIQVDRLRYVFHEGAKLLVTHAFFVRLSGGIY